jgi:hypothetical protein
VAEEFEGDLAGAVFWGADLSGARFRDVDLSGAAITHALLVGVDIDATIDRLVVNGVDVTAYVNERDAWYPLRTMLTPADPDAVRASWAAIRAAWKATATLADGLDDDVLRRSVGGEWSYLETLRHLVFATDKWFTVPVLEGGFDPIGMPNRGSVDFPWPGLDQGATPTTAEVLASRASCVARTASSLAELDAAALDRTVDILENGPHTVRQCVHTVLEEEFWHLRYARRDLALLGHPS